jgi:excisionase family DNA binding protein
MAPDLPTREVARQFGVTSPTVCQWIRAGQLRATRLPGKRPTYRVSVDELERFRRVNARPAKVARTRRPKVYRFV